MSTIYLKEATMDDLPRVTEIINKAREVLKDRGVDQWQDGYPEPDLLVEDIRNRFTYMMMLDGEAVATAALQRTVDANYDDIEEGSWRDDSLENHTVIHRIAVDPNYSGQNLSDTMIHHLLTLSRVYGFKDVRIDTHFDNLAMQHVIEKNGFEYRGIIRMFDSKEPRKAYQLILD